MRMRQTRKKVSRLRLLQLERRIAPASFNTLISRADATLSVETAGGTTNNATMVSSDGRYVTFDSLAGNVFPGQIDTNGDSDVFIYDGLTNTTQLVSRAIGTTLGTGNGKSYDPRTSAEGRFIVFRSTATNLIAGMSSLYPGENFFIYDRVAQSCALVTHQFDSATTRTNGAVTKFKISANGQTVIFSSKATNLVPGLSNPFEYWHAYAYSVATGQIKLLDHEFGNPATPSNYFAYADGVSADGRYVVISSAATNLTNPPTEKNCGNAFRYDLLTGQNSLITKSTITGKVGCNGYTSQASISANGNWISFESAATDLIAGYTGSNIQIYQYDVMAGQMVLVSRDFADPSKGGNGDSRFGLLSDNGQVITYRTSATNLINGFIDANADGTDIFIYNRGTNQTTLISHKAGSNTTSGNKYAGYSLGISADGKFTVFSAAATDLIQGFVDGSGSEYGNVFVYDMANDSLSVVNGRYGSPTISANQYCQIGGISADGNTIVYTTAASDIISGLVDLNGSDDVFVRNVSSRHADSAIHRFRRVEKPNGSGKVPMADSSSTRIPRRISCPAKSIPKTRKMFSFMIGNSMRPCW